MKICDLTQFYSPLSGGVKRYVHEKIAYIQRHCEAYEHILVVPGPRTEVIASERSKIYSIHSPLLSRTSRYRALLNLRTVDEILERERPDIIESSDPYQIGWRALRTGRELRIPVVAFYHSHFPEAYLRSTDKFLGHRVTAAVMKLARHYVRDLYNRFAVTLAPSEALVHLLEEWGVRNARAVGLGVDPEIFRPEPDDRKATRLSLGDLGQRTLLLYVGRLSPEKNTTTLCEAFAALEARCPGRFHLLVIGDGPQRDCVIERQQEGDNISWIRYCSDSHDLARYYRAADLFVHPGVQETFGLVALESQACGTPVVGIKGSYMDRIILHDQAGWARENSAVALSEAIENFSSYRPARSLEEMSDLASRLHSWPRVFEQLFCIYSEVCAQYRQT